MAVAALFGRELVKQYIKFKAAPAAARAYYKVRSNADQFRKHLYGRIVVFSLCGSHALAQISSGAAHSLGRGVACIMCSFQWICE